MDATTPRATASAQTGDVERSSRTSGRTTRTKGVSLRPGELEDAKVVEELTGVGFSEVYRRHFAPQMHAAAQLLRDLRDDGVELDRARLRTEWDLTATPEALADLYIRESRLAFGD